MSKKKSELLPQVSEKAKESKISRKSKVDFELSDEELEDASGGCKTTNNQCGASATYRPL